MMVADTIIVVLVCIMPAQQPQESNKRSTPLFEQFDLTFNKKHKFNISSLRSASKHAKILAEENTKVEHDRVLNLFKDIDAFGRKEKK